MTGIHELCKKCLKAQFCYLGELSMMTSTAEEPLYQEGFYQWASIPSQTCRVNPLGCAVHGRSTKLFCEGSRRAYR
eukprot:scaffold2417_cov447-Pavlova_lutheri.AAC.1